MNFEWTYIDDNTDWVELSHLYKIAPLGDKPADNLETVFGNSLYKCFVRESGRLVAVGRVLADGIDCAYLCDVAVHPDYQGHGLGKQVIQTLAKLSKGHKKIILYANPGKEGFYQKLGFKPMNTAMAIFENQDHALDIGLIRENLPHNVGYS